MSSDTAEVDSLDLAQGVALSRLADGAMLAGHVGDEQVMLARRGDEIFAVGAVCTHYGAPLADGLVVGDTVRCPWHHACFSLRTGEALRAPALTPIPCFDVEQADGVVRVRARRAPAPGRTLPSRAGLPDSIVIVGGGAAGQAAAETLRREGYAGRLTMLSADAAPPYDRPNLSKGFLAGTSPDSANPLRTAEFYGAENIELKLDAQVGAIDTSRRHVELTDGTRYSYDALLLATGAAPVRLGAGDDLPHVHYLRTLADSHALTAEAVAGRRAVVIGASFIGLEVAASLRARGVEVHVVAPETIPMRRILGEALGEHIRRLHERHGVTQVERDGASGRAFQQGERVGERDRRARFERADVDGRRRVGVRSVERARHTALIGRDAGGRRQCIVAGVERRAVGEQRMRGCRSAVVLQRADLRVACEQVVTEVVQRAGRR